MQKLTPFLVLCPILILIIVFGIIKTAIANDGRLIAIPIMISSALLLLFVFFLDRVSLKYFSRKTIITIESILIIIALVYFYFDGF